MITINSVVRVHSSSYKHSKNMVGKLFRVMSIVNDKYLLRNTDKSVAWFHRNQITKQSTVIANKHNKYEWGQRFILTESLGHSDFIAGTQVMIVREIPNSTSGRLAIIAIGKETVRTVLPGLLR